jgi:hypothetical protein
MQKSLKPSFKKYLPDAKCRKENIDGKNRTNSSFFLAFCDKKLEKCVFF